MKQSVWVFLALPLLMIPARAAGPYHDCRPSEDIINGRTVHKTVCQNDAGDWVEVQPERKMPAQAPLPVATAQKPAPVKRPVYHDCRPSEDIVNGRTVHKIVCQNEAGSWVEVPPEALQAQH
jgi:hypothetical protein